MECNQSASTCENCSRLLLKQYIDWANLKDMTGSPCSRENIRFPMNHANKPFLNKGVHSQVGHHNLSYDCNSFDSSYSTPDTIQHSAENIHYGYHRKPCSSRDSIGSQIPFRMAGRPSRPTSRIVSNHSYNSEMQKLQDLIIGAAHVQGTAKSAESNEEYASPYNCSYLTSKIPGHCKSQKTQKMCEIDVPLLTFDSPLVPMENCRYDGLFIHDSFPCDLPKNDRTTFDVTELFNEFINCYMNNTNTLFEELNKYGFDKLKKDYELTEGNNFGTPKSDYCQSCDILVDKVANLLMKQTNLFPQKKQKSCECKKKKTCFEEFDEKYGPMIESVLTYISKLQPKLSVKEEKERANSEPKTSLIREGSESRKKSVAIDPFFQPSSSIDKKNKKVLETK